MLHIVQVVAQSFLEAGATPPAMNLGETGQAGPDGFANFVAAVLFLEAASELRSLGPGANKAHLAFEDVPKLREFIQAETAKNAANGCAARVVLDGPDRTQFPLGALIHSPEFDDGETLSREPHATLSIEDRSPVCEVDGGGDRSQQRAQENQSCG